MSSVGKYTTTSEILKGDQICTLYLNDPFIYTNTMLKTIIDSEYLAEEILPKS